MIANFNQLGIAGWKRVAFCTLAIALSTLPLRAQRGAAPPSNGSGGTRGPTGGMPASSSGTPTLQPGISPDAQPGMPPDMQPGVLYPTTEQPSMPVVVEDEMCLPWDLPDTRGATVSAIRLGVPSKARKEYNKACDAFKKKEWPAAEEHVRGAIQIYSKYVAAWVMLGQVLQDEQKMKDAHDACSQALTVDPTYLPPYLCLAGLLDREDQWGDLLTLSNQFLGLNSVGDRYVYYYRAKAYLNTSKLPEAQKNVLEAIAIDNEHHQPGLYLLLARIYGEQGDVADAAVQVRQFLKFSSDRQEKDAAKQYLSELQSKQNAK